ncbi:hypothetical protein AQB9606_03087 [Aquabacterium sp. CECT 9606]|nr:hypothetical protein AQB9606_03087 [Aquabacterium sp. CECT 9606]
MALGNIQIDQQARHRFGAHGGASIGVPGATSWRETVSAMSCWASSALARGANIQHTTKRLKVFRIT